MPVIFQESEIQKELSVARVRDSVTARQSLIATGNGRGFATEALPDELQLTLRKCFPVQRPIVRRIEIARLEAILDIVRTRVVEWTIGLEKQGTHGENMALPPHSVRPEPNPVSPTIVSSTNNIYGGANTLVSNAVSSSFTTSINAMDMDSLLRYLDSQGLSKVDQSELKGALAAEPARSTEGTFGPKVASWIGGMVGKAASGVWKVSMSTAIDVLPRAISAYYGLPY